MKIVCLVKQVPRGDAINFDPETRTLRREGVPLLLNPFDAAASIDAQGHLMHDLLARFGSVPLALAAYNAGPGAVARCGCVPPFAETQAYVAKIIGLLGGAGDGSVAGTMEVRLVE